MRRRRERLDRDFVLLWAGQGVSQVGDAVTLLALPLTAVLALHASTFQVGALQSATAAAWILLSLPAGAWADRLRRRRVIIACDAFRAVVLASVPLAYAFGELTLAQLYVVAFTAGAAMVLFSVTYAAYLPSLIPAEQVTAGNARLSTTAEAANIAGAGVGGVLVSLLSGPGALLVDDVSFAVAAVSSTLIRHREPKPARSEQHLRHDIADGLRTTLGNPVLRALAGFSGLFNLLFTALGTVTIVLLARGLHFSGALIGASYILAGIGGVTGGLLAPRIIGRLGIGRAAWLPSTLTMPFALLEPLVNRGIGLVPYAIGTLVVDAGIITFNVTIATYLQTRVPQQMLGRTTSVVRLVSRGAAVAGGLLAGLLAWWLGLRGAMWALTAVIGALPLLQALSPLRRLGDPVESPVT